MLCQNLVRTTLKNRTFFLANRTFSRLCCKIWCRASQNFKHEKFIWDQAVLYSLRKRNAEKCENYRNWTTFKGSYWPSKFYYITRLRDVGENSKIYFFQVFYFELYLYFHNHKSSCKMWSFEIHYVGVALKMYEWEGR